MNPGIAQGFVRFGSVACRVLRHLHEFGPCTAGELKRSATRSETVQLSATLLRLQAHGFVFAVGRHRPSGSRSFVLYDLKRPKYPELTRTPPLTQTERTRAYRERRALKVASVFNFRGKIPLTTALKRNSIPTSSTRSVNQ